MKHAALSFADFSFSFSFSFPCPIAPQRLTAHRVLSAMLCFGLALQPLAFAQRTPLGDVPMPKARQALPQLGSTADEQMSLSQEKALGRVLWRDLRSEPDVMLDPLLTDYLQQLVQRLALPLALPPAQSLRGFIVADSSLNAFALPSGLMGVHSGLLLASARESELAAVLSHEIGHVSQRHFARGLANQKDSAWIGLAGFAAAILAAKKGSAKDADQLIQGAIAGSQALAANKQLAFSRDMEREADAVGFGLMQDAGLDATDMVRMLRRLGASSSLNETGTVYARSHPGVTERMASVEARLRTPAVSNQSKAPPALDFLLLQARVRALLAQSSEQIEAAQGYFEAQLTQTAQTNGAMPPAAKAITQSAAHYGLALLALQAKQTPKAAAHLDTAQAALNAQPIHPWLEALAFDLAPQRPSLTAFIARHGVSALSVHAVASAVKALASAPLSATELTAAHTVLGDWLAQRPQDDTAWASLAQVYQQQGQSAPALWAQAEQTAAMGVWASSITLLSDALRAGEASVPITTQNQWRERLLELRQIAADEKVLIDKFK
jgi:beta-barrel assembly-enhancing protease